MEVFFISGHINLTQQEFDLHYVDQIDQSIKKGGIYVIGNAQGGDTMALEYLLKKGVDPKKITIYFYNRYGDSQSKKYIDRGLKVITEFKSYTNRDAHMTISSNTDILWIRPESENIKLLGSAYKKGHVSGTEKNLLRRKQNSLY